MNIFDLMPNFRAVDAGGEASEVRETPAGRKSLGPAKTRYLTNGQVRRLGERARKAKTDKNNVSNRKAWMANRLAMAVLRGQLESLAAGGLVGASGQILYPARLLPIVDDLTAKFGSIDQAQAHYDAVLAENAR